MPGSRAVLGAMSQGNGPRQGTDARARLRGRPLTMTAEIRASICAFVELGISQRVAAALASVSGKILEMWLACGRKGGPVRLISCVANARAREGYEDAARTRARRPREIERGYVDARTPVLP